MLRRPSTSVLLVALGLVAACSSGAAPHPDAPDRAAPDTGSPSSETGSLLDPDVPLAPTPPDATWRPSDTRLSDPRPDAGSDAGPPDCEADGDRDADGLENCRETRLCTDPSAGDTDGDHLGDLEEHDGRTDPCSPDTDGDGVVDGREHAYHLDPTDPTTFGDRPDADLWRLGACEPPSTDPVSTHESTDGNWRLTLPATFDNYTALQIDGAAPPVAAAVYGDPVLEIAGAVVSDRWPYSPSPYGALTDVSSSVLFEIDDDLTGDDGDPFQTHDGHSAVIGRYTVEPDQPVSARQLRDRIALGAAPFSRDRVSGLPAASGKRHAAFRVFVSVVVRRTGPDTHQQVISLAVAPLSRFENDPKVRFRVDDLTNTTHLTELENGRRTTCTGDELVPRSPKVDFYWVVDHSASMNDDRATVLDFARELATRAASTQLDYRMGVTNTDHRNDGRLRAPPGWHSERSVLEQTLRRAAFECSPGRPWHCDRGAEYGLESARRGIRALTGNSSDPTDPARQIRENATLITLFVTDDDARTIEDQRGNGTYHELVRPFLEFFPDHTTAFTLAGTSTCGDGPGRAYRDVAYETGGWAATLCDENIRDLIPRIIREAHDLSPVIPLSRTPITSSLHVRLNDRWIPRSPTDGFVYDRDAGDIRLTGKYRPEPRTENDRTPTDYVAVGYETYQSRCKTDPNCRFSPE